MSSRLRLLAFMLVGTKSIGQSCKVGKRGADSVDPVPLFYTPYPSPDNESQNTTFRRVKKCVWFVAMAGVARARWNNGYYVVQCVWMKDSMDDCTRMNTLTRSATAHTTGTSLHIQPQRIYRKMITGFVDDSLPWGEGAQARQVTLVVSIPFVPQTNGIKRT